MKKFLEKIGIKRATNKTIKATNPNLTAKEVQKRMLVFGGIIIFSLLLVLGKLFLVQVVSHESYIEKLANYTRRYETITTPRGEFKDRNGNLIVTNKITKSIIYYPPLDQDSEAKWELALKFANNFTLDDKKLNESDLDDLFIFLYPKEAKARLSDDELLAYQKKEINDSEYTLLIKSYIDEVDHAKLSEEQRLAYKVYQRMTMSTSGGMKMIVNDVSNAEIAYLAEHNLEYPGFESFSNWDREYLDSYGLRGIIGSVSTETQGIPLENSDYYLARDYARNERMGRSGLELYYEDIVSGDKKVQDVIYSKDGYANPIEVSPGAKGDNLIMSIDLDLQKASEEIVIRHIEAEKNNPNRKYFNTAYLIVSDPKTGDLLSSVVIKTDKDGKLYSDSSANHLDTIIPGSTIKGAMVYLGLSENVVSPTEQISDAPIKIASTPLKRSYQNLVSTNAVSSLAQSSNVYMFHVAMRIANARYAYDQPLLGVDIEDFKILRNNFSRFGLGSKTGIDMPSEGDGYIGYSFAGGFLLDYAMGQYDSYTPMQLATYINTIANDGVRMKPRYISRAEDPITGLSVYENKAEVVSTLEDKAALKYVQQGFRACVTEGLCRGVLNHDRYSVAAKTGTAEAMFTNEDGELITDAPHSLLVGYAPYENPEVSVTCVTPHSMNGGVMQSNICQPIANEVFDYYFNNK